MTEDEFDETPVTPEKRERLGGTPPREDWQAPFIEHFSHSANVTASCKHAGVSRATAYRHIERSPEFKAEVSDAKEQSLDVLEGEAFRRGVEGVLVPKAIAGRRELVREYDTTLLLALLNAHGKSRGFTRDSRVQLSGDIKTVHTVRITTTKRRTYGGKTGNNGNVAAANGNGNGSVAEPRT